MDFGHRSQSFCCQKHELWLGHLTRDPSVATLWRHRLGALHERSIADYRTVGLWTAYLAHLEVHDTLPPQMRTALNQA